MVKVKKREFLCGKVYLVFIDHKVSPQYEVDKVGREYVVKYMNAFQGKYKTIKECEKRIQGLNVFLGVGI